MSIIISPLLFSTIASIITTVASLCAIIAGFVFGYQWFRFGLNRFVAASALAVYLGGCIAIISKMILTVPLLQL